MLKSFKEGVFSAIHLLLVLLLVSGGVLLILGSFMKNLQNSFIHILLAYPNFLLSIGIAIGFFGLVLLFGFYSMYKPRYYQIAMGQSKVLVEKNIIQDYIKNYWNEVFPTEKADLDVVIRSKGVIEIVTTSKNHTSPFFLEKVQNELGAILKNKLGYEGKFILTLIE